MSKLIGLRSSVPLTFLFPFRPLHLCVDSVVEGEESGQKYPHWLKRFLIRLVTTQPVNKDPFSMHQRGYQIACGIIPDEDFTVYLCPSNLRPVGRPGDDKIVYTAGSAGL